MNLPKTGMLRPLAPLMLIPILGLAACGGDAPAPAPKPAEATPLSESSAATTSTGADSTSTPASRNGETTDPTTTTSASTRASAANDGPDRIEATASTEAGGNYQVETVGRDFYQWKQFSTGKKFFEPFWTTYVDGQKLEGNDCSSTMQLLDPNGLPFEQMKTTACSRTATDSSDHFEKLNVGAPGLKRGEESPLQMIVTVETPDGRTIEGTYEFMYRYPNT